MMKIEGGGRPPLGSQMASDGEKRSKKPILTQNRQNRLRPIISRYGPYTLLTPSPSFMRTLWTQNHSNIAALDPNTGPTSYWNFDP